MIRVYKFRLYPKKREEKKLLHMLEITRFVYNQQLDYKIQTYQHEGKSLSAFDLNNHLTDLKKNYKHLNIIHSQVLQEINQRIVLAFKHFYRRIQQKEQPGFPRFKSTHRYHSLTYPQSGFVMYEKHLSLSKIGMIPLVQHRKIEGKIKTLTIKRTSTNQWYACFSVDMEKPIRKAPAHKVIGIDVGLHHFYADSDKHIIDNPRYLRKAEEKLKALQRKHARKKNGGKNRLRSRLQLARIHEHIRNQRLDFLHKLSRTLADSYHMIAVEDLHVKNMVKNHFLAKSIADASWSTFLQLLSYKVVETGGKIVEVNPRNTSQQCICGNIVPKSLAVRVHYCENCGMMIDRDIMAAMIIQQRAFQPTTVGSTESNAWGNVSRETSMNQESHCI